MVEAFKKWMLQQGYSVATVNHRLSVIKVYAKLASKAGAIDKLEYLQIKDVNGYSGKEGKRIDKQRETTRIGSKKADHTSLTTSQAKTLKDWMVHEGEQGSRDCLLMCLLLDHGLRCGEVAILKAGDFDLPGGRGIAVLSAKGRQAANPPANGRYLASFTGIFEHTAVWRGR